MCVVCSSNASGDQVEPESEFPDDSDFPDSAFRGEDASSESSSSSFSSPSASADSSSSCGDSDREWNHRRPNNNNNNPTAAAATGGGYKYKKLGELCVGEKKVNLIGMVKDFKPPAVSQGSDHYSTLTLLDETDPRVGVKCLMFNRKPERLPQVKSVGDIVCLHRVSVDSFNCQVQVRGVWFSSAIRFSGELGRKVSPSTGSVSFTLTHAERQRVKELRRWARGRRSEALCCLQSVVPGGQCFDLACQIVSVTISKVPRCTVLTLWDGTAHTLRCKKLKLEKCHEEGYPIVEEDSGLSEDSEGYQVHVVVLGKKCRRKAAGLLPGAFVCLQSVTSAADASGSVEMSMVEGESVVFDRLPARIEVLGKNDDLRTCLEERIGRLAEAVTITPHQEQPLNTVADVLGYNGPMPAKFRCRVRVLGVNAPSVEDMVNIRCYECNRAEMITRAKQMDSDGIAEQPCSVCSRAPSCQFYFKMAVGDKTGSTEIEVAHEQAIELFNNLKPNNFYQYQAARYQLLEKLYCLTGGNAPFAARVSGAVEKPRPWVECCLLVIRHQGSLFYGLFDTELKNSSSSSS